MRKKLELETGCMAHAGEQEMTFVLLSRDLASPVAIRAWINERIRLRKNTADDPQIIEAKQCAAVMEDERGIHKPKVRFGSPGCKGQTKKGIEDERTDS